MMQHADTAAAERIRHPSTEEEKEWIYYFMIGRGIAAFIRRSVRGFRGGGGPRRIRFAVVLYLLDGAVFDDILKKPVITGIQRSNKGCRAVKGLVI